MMWGENSMFLSSHKKISRKYPFMIAALLALVFVVPESHSFVAKEGYDCNAPENKDHRTKIDMKLAKKYRKKKKTIKKDLIALDESLKVRLTFFPMNINPPMNLGIGRCISAENGRLAIKKALEFNRGIGFVIMQEFMPHHWMRVGLTDLAELTWIAITPDDLAMLSDPSLSDEQFQKTYRELATLKERKLPFGMGTRKIEAEEEK